MNIKTFKVPIFDWDCLVIKVAETDTENNLKRVLRNRGIKGDDYDKAYSDLMKTPISHNSGVCVTYNRHQFACIAISPQTTKENLYKTLIHEGRHLTDDILKWHGIEDDETAAYLTEYIIYELIKDIIDYEFS